jgi:ribonuclease PH
MPRLNQRQPDQLRDIRITRHYTRHAEGSVLIECGDTKVICTASVEDKVPGFLKGRGQGWVTAEYGMLPRSTHTRVDREAAKRQAIWTHSGNPTLDRPQRARGNGYDATGERTIQLDCDVHPSRRRYANGQHHRELRRRPRCDHGLIRDGRVSANPLRDQVAAVSVGICDGVPLLDLDYAEDSACATDMNVVMTGSGGIVEVQGTAERESFSRVELDALLDLAGKGIRQLVRIQRAALDQP